MQEFCPAVVSFLLCTISYIHVFYSAQILAVIGKYSRSLGLGTRFLCINPNEQLPEL